MWKSAQAQNLTIRIIEGFFGVQRNDRGAQLILLKVKVDGMATSLKDWKLDLQREGKDWQTGWVQPIKNEIRFEEESASTEFRKHQMISDTLSEPFSLDVRAEPIPEVSIKDSKITHPILGQLVPESGWLLFRVEHAAIRFPDLLFGATFVLVAVETSGAKSDCKQAAGEWLRRAIIAYP
jgi:hypothetical protein